MRSAGVDDRVRPRPLPETWEQAGCHSNQGQQG
jgi:hypothetical protein